MAETRSIPLDMEIVVQVAFRFRKAQFAEPRSFAERYRVRTPDEIQHAISEIEQAIWAGTLQSVHERLQVAAPDPEKANG